MPLSAYDEESLTKIILNLSKIWNDNINNQQYLSDICYTLTNRRYYLNQRAFICDTAENINYILSNYNNATVQKRVFKGKTLENKQRDIIMVFCGQGAQWKNMGIELYNNNKIFKECMDKCCNVVKERINKDLLEIIQKDDVNESLYSQPATTAIEISIYELYKSWGIKPTCVCGHSSGEIASSYAADAITLEEAMIVALYRGKCIQELSPKNGGMAALGTSEEIAKQLIISEDDICIAAYNSPNSVTLSGNKEALESLGKALTEEGYFFRQLNVTHAYHSSHMLPAMPKYKEYMNDIKGKNKLTARLFSSVIGNEIKNGNEINSDYFINNLTKPVLFQQIISKLYKEYPDGIFLEIGPHPTLRRPILQSCDSNVNQSQAFGSLIRDTNSITAIKKSIGQLYCNGNVYENAINTLVPDGNLFYNLPNYPYNKQKLWLLNEESEKYINIIL